MGEIHKIKETDIVVSIGHDNFGDDRRICEDRIVAKGRLLKPFCEIQ